MSRCAFFQNTTCILEPHNAQPSQCKSFPVLIDEFNFLRLSRSNIPCLNSESYLFSWDEILGNDNERLIKFLSQKFSIDWIKTAKIEKFNTNPNEYKWHEGQTIKLTNEKNYLSLRYNLQTESKLNINLELDDGRTDEFILKKENGKLNVYDNSIPAYIILENEISLLTSHIDQDFYTKLVMLLTQSQADDYIPSDKKFISLKGKYLQTIASHINASTAQDVAEQVRDLLSFDKVSYEKIHKQFEEGSPTGADEGFIYIEHKNLIDPMYYNLIKNLVT